MDLNQQSSIFGLNIDESHRGHLSEAARWGRFLAIVGFVLCGIIVLAGIYIMISLNRIQSQFSDYPGYRRSAFDGFGVGVVLAYITFAVVCFFPCLFLLRFSNATKTALAGNDQAQLAESFKNLKVTLRYVGIIAIIILCLYGLSIVINLLNAAT